MESSLADKEAGSTSASREPPYSGTLNDPSEGRRRMCYNEYKKYRHTSQAPNHPTSRRRSSVCNVLSHLYNISYVWSHIGYFPSYLWGMLTLIDGTTKELWLWRQCSISETLTLWRQCEAGWHAMSSAWLVSFVRLPKVSNFHHMMIHVVSLNFALLCCTKIVFGNISKK